MKRVDLASAKLTVVFPEGKLPAIDPADPAFVLVLGGLEILGKVNPKAARKLAQHRAVPSCKGSWSPRGANWTSSTRGSPGSIPRPKRRWKVVRSERPDCSLSAPVRIQRGASMTDAELRIIEFLMTSEATGPADLPDWMLALLEGDRPDELSHELITASLIYVRRLHPGIRFNAARALIAGYADDPAQIEELSGRIAAFRLACCFERLKRSGRFEDVFIDDPFDPEGSVSVKLTEAEWRSVNRAPTPRDTSHGPHDFSRN